MNETMLVTTALTITVVWGIVMFVLGLVLGAKFVLGRYEIMMDKTIQELKK